MSTRGSAGVDVGGRRAPRYDRERHGRWGWRALHFLFCALASVACGDNSDPTESSASACHAMVPLPQAEYQVEIATPQSVDPLGIVLAATEGIRVGARACVTSRSDAPSVITNVGESETVIGPRARIGTVWSRSNVNLGHHVQAAGTIYAPRVDSGNDVSIAGGEVTDAAIDPLEIATLNVEFPAGTAENVRVRVGRATQRDPGRYGTVLLAPGAELTLRTGSYYVERLVVSPSAQVVLEQDSGPVFLYVRQTLELRGSIVSTSDDEPDLLMVYLGTAATSISAPFHPTFRI